MNHADDILDDLFQGCAFAAFVEQARIEQGCPDPERTRRMAYEFFEEELAVKNGRFDKSRGVR